MCILASAVAHLVENHFSLQGDAQGLAETTLCCQAQCEITAVCQFRYDPSATYVTCRYRTWPTS